MKVISHLIVFGLALSISGCSGRQPDRVLHATSELNATSILAYETAKGPNEKLRLAAYLGDTGKLREALVKGAEINSTDESGSTALQIAATYGNLEAATLLIERGAQVNLTDAFGRSPLHLAATWGHGDVVHLLLEHHANSRLRTSRGESPLQAAIGIGDMGIIHALQDAGRGRGTASE